MKLFITGASGFVGKALLPDALAMGHEVFALARREAAAKELEQLGAIPVWGDLLNVEAFRSYLKGIDAVIHLAAKIRFVGPLEDFVQINVEPTKNLIEAAIAVGVGHFIYVSAAALALDGTSLNDIDESYEPVRKFKSNYLESKRLAEELLLKQKTNIRIVILRPPIIWGPNMGLIEEYRSTIQLMGFPTIGDPRHHMATCHVRNLGAAILGSMKSDSANGVFLIADREKVEVRSFMKDLLRGYGLKMGNLRLPKWLAIWMAGVLEFIWNTFRIKGSPPINTLMVHLMGTEFTMDDSKARKELSYQQVVSVDEGLIGLQS